MHLLATHGVGQHAGQKFIEHDTKSIDIRATVQAFGTIPKLLGTHVLNCPNKCPGISPHRGEVQVRVGTAGHTKIYDFWHSVAVYEYVSGLEIPVDYPPVVAMTDSLTDLLEQAESVPDSQASFAREVRDRLGVGNELHDEKWHVADIAGVTPNDEDLRDARVLEFAKKLCLPLEPPHGLL